MFVPTAYFGGEAPDVYDNLFRGSWDASNASSYPGTGTNWFNASGSGTFVESNGTFVTWTNNGDADYFSYSNNAYHSIGSFGFEMIDGSLATTYGSGFTISMWVNPGTMTGGEGYFSLQSGGGTDRMEIEIDAHNNRFSFNTNEESGTSVFTGDSAIFSAGSWYNLVFTYDGVTFKGYVNNSLQTSGPKSNPAYTTSTTMDVNLFMGFTPTYNNNSGDIAMMEMWNRGIRSDEVTDIWNYHKARFGY